MDSQVQVEGRLLDVVDDQWRTETLPLDDIHVRTFCLIIIHLPSSPMVYYLIAQVKAPIIVKTKNDQVPATELPDPEADNANPGDSLRQQVSN